jgi:WD40 repeat protein
LWDATGKELLTLTGHAPGVECLAFSPDGQRFASGASLFRDINGKTYPSEVKVWNVSTGKELLSWQIPSGIFSLAFSPDGRRLFTPGGTKSGEVAVWDAATGEEISHWGTATMRGVNYLALSPDGKRLASEFGGGAIQIWDSTTGHDLLTLRGHTERLTGLAFSSDGRRLASASMDGTIRIWDGTPRAERVGSGDSLPMEGK